MEMRRRQTSYSSISADDYGAYEPNVCVGSKLDQQYYPDPESRSMHVMNVNKKSKKKSCFSLFFSIVQFAALCGVSYFAYMSYMELEDTVSQLALLNEEYSVLKDTYTETESELTRAGEIFSMVKTKMKSLYPDSADKQGIEESKHLFDVIMRRQEAQNERIDNLQKSIQKLNTKQLQEKYGPGPYEIEATVIVDGQKKFFTIETAPNHLMPHSVKMFMELVESNTYENTPLMITDHIFLSRLPEHISHDNTKHLTFPEYSPEFPHLQNTIGFATRPGGPQIYINVEDNSQAHGPGGQKHHALIEEADSCFGKIIRGLDVIEQIGKSEKASIERMSLLKAKNNK